MLNLSGRTYSKSAFNVSYMEHWTSQGAKLPVSYIFS